MRPLRIWLPTIRAGSGSDVFAERLAAGLKAAGQEASITWFPHLCEMMPGTLQGHAPPPGTDIIHTNTSYAFAFKRPGTKLVATELHYLLDPNFRPYKSIFQHMYQKLLIGAYLRKSYAAADAVTAISAFTARVLAKEAGVRVAAAVPLWVDTKVFKPSQDPARQSGPFRLLFIGNASRRKGADVIPELARKLGRGFEIRCTAGLRQQLKSGGLGNVNVLGKLREEDLVREYQECDAVLVPSRYEGFGYAALEGMACAKPIVGFRSGAIAEVVGAAGSHLLVDLDDLDALTDVCRALDLDPEQGRAAGRAGFHRCMTTYAAERAINSYIQLYESLIQVA